MNRLCATALTLVMLAAGCGDSADNNDNNGDTNNGATNNGATNNGATNNGATNNGATNNGATNNGATNNGATNNGATNNGTTALAPSFADDVAPIIIASCALGSCHLEPGNGTSFTVGAAADVAAVQTALEGVQTGAGVDLVAGGDADNSELYLRITGTNRLKMPIGGSLTDDQIGIITAWIDAGATF